MIDLNSAIPTRPLEVEFLGTLASDMKKRILRIQPYGLDWVKQLGALFKSENNNSPIPLGEKFLFLGSIEEISSGKFAPALSDDIKIFLETEHVPILTGLFILLAESIEDNTSKLNI